MARLRPAPIVVLLLAAATVRAALPADEKPPVPQLPCFPGAIYRKAVSSVDQWAGIETVVTLPAFTPDPARVGANGRPLDNASCYVGGRSGETEIDVGVSWEVIREPDGSVSKQRKAFRPFWRNKKWFSAPARPDLYFYPGDTIAMTCRTEAKDKLVFSVRLIRRADGSTPKPDAAASTTQPGTLEVTLDAPGFGPGRAQEFKRVTAIDQVGNEGVAASKTRATVTGARWTSVTLLRDNGDRRPMVAERFTDMRCPDAGMVAVQPTDDAAAGGERIDLHGTPADAR